MSVASNDKCDGRTIEPKLIMVYRRAFYRRQPWWTKERVILGLQQFVKRFGFCPTSHEEYWKRTRYTGKIVNGRYSNRGQDHPYPSTAAIGKFWKTMREAWTAAGFNVDAGYEAWSPMEDWFVIESCGILPREEVARVLKRTVPAVKRRLYDLGGITANTRWGITISAVERHLGVAQHVVRRYLEHGTIGYFRGYKNIYINPADLIRLKEFDWESERARELAPELLANIKSCLIQRALKILKYRENWRDHEIYKIQRVASLYNCRIKNERIPMSIKEPAPPPPNDLQVDNWVKIKNDIALGVAGRVGIIRAVFYSPMPGDRRDGTRRKCWMARVEFPRLRLTKSSNEERIRYGIPLDCLEHAEKPAVEPKPLSNHPDAIRQRTRYGGRKHRADHKLVRVDSLSQGSS